MTGKQRLQTILDGAAPDAPPHFELVYQIEEAVFGMKPQGEGGSDRERREREVVLYERPDELHARARAKCDRAKEWLRRMAEAGSDFFILAHDFGFNEGPFVSPAHFAQFVAPYLTEIVGTIHDLGKKAILHSDGDLRAILDQIHATGIDGYQSVDPQGHMDIRLVREAYPEWILMGNVMTSMMQKADDAAIRGSVGYCMEYGGIGKRYILSTSNCIFRGMPEESYRIMLDEYRNRIS